MVTVNRICSVLGNSYQNTRQGVKQSRGVVGGSDVCADVSVKRGHYFIHDGGASHDPT